MIDRERGPARLRRSFQQILERGGRGDSERAEERQGDGEGGSEREERGEREESGDGERARLEEMGNLDSLQGDNIGDDNFGGGEGKG